VELFKLSTPDNAPEGCGSLYYRTVHGNLTKNQNGYELSDNAIVTTDTYFNIFSSSKYSEYTKAENITFTTKVSGKLNICLHVLTAEKDDVIEQVPVDSETPMNVSIQFSINGLSDKENATCHYVSFESQGTSTIHEFGSYSTETEQTDIRLAVIICTFKREEYVDRTVEALKGVISDPSYDPKQIDIFVIDNGRTLTDDAFSEPYVHLIPNRNLGGSGGFARGMIEACEHNATHILLMDDDIILDPNSVYKTFNILKILKEEHKDAFILGGMLDSNKPTMQYEAGALYDGEFRKRKGDLDLLSPESLLYNDRYERTDYGGWWYACIPAHICKDNLPLPLFVKMDDVEYCLRNMNDHLIMNGIGVWHETFSNKQNRIGEYYYLRRNSNIVKSVSELGMDSFTHDFWKDVMYLISLSDQISLDLYLRAISDYMKGIDFLIETDEEKLHEELQRMDTTNETYQPGTGNRKALLRSIFTRFFWRNFTRGLKLRIKYLKDHKEISKEYQTRSNELTNIKMWKHRLNI